MALNFPSSPSEGQIFRPGGGLPNYYYRTGRWIKKIGTADSYNRLVNPAMQVSQETGNTASAVSADSAYYPADQWNIRGSVSPGTMSSQRVQVATPRGSKDRIRVTVGTAKAVLAAGDYVQLRQQIEGNRLADFRYGSAAAISSMLRFGFKGPAGNYGVSIRNAAVDRAYVVMFTVSAGQANTDTEQFFSVPGDTTGVWPVDNGLGCYLTITPASGSTYQGALGWQAGVFTATSALSNGMAAAGAVFELFDVGWYADPNNTGVAPEFQAPELQDTILECMRYWYKLYGSRGFVISATQLYTAANHYVPMRVAPSFSIVGPVLGYDLGVAPVLTSIGPYQGDSTYTSLVPVASGFTVPRAGSTLCQGTTNNYIAVSARM